MAAFGASFLYKSSQNRFTQVSPSYTYSSGPHTGHPPRDFVVWSQQRSQLTWLTSKFATCSKRSRPDGPTCLLSIYDSMSKNTMILRFSSSSWNFSFFGAFKQQYWGEYSYSSLHLWQIYIPHRCFSWNFLGIIFQQGGHLYLFQHILVNSMCASKHLSP